MHPHEQEELEYQAAYREGEASYDSREATMGAGWKSQEWNNENPWLLTSRDVWVANPHYVGPECPHPEMDLDEEQWDEHLEEVALYYAHMDHAEFLETHEENDDE